jgi:hypothetical protein
MPAPRVPVIAIERARLHQKLESENPIAPGQRLALALAILERGRTRREASLKDSRQAEGKGAA